MLVVPGLPCHRQCVAYPQLKKTDSRLAARCAAVASVGAAVIHLAVAPTHWRDWVASGLFFAALAIFQVVWAWLAWSRPTSLVLAAGLLVNAGSVALWVTSRIAGLPFGPYAGQPEAVDSAGIAAVLLQCYVMMGAWWAWLRSEQPEQVSGVSRALVLVGTNAVMAGAVAVGLASSFQGYHRDHHHGVTEAQGGHPATHEPPPAAPVGAPQPSPEAGLPVTDMGLDTAEAAQPAAADPELPAAVDPDADGHDHHHGD